MAMQTTPSRLTIWTSRKARFQRAFLLAARRRPFVLPLIDLRVGLGCCCEGGAGGHGASVAPLFVAYLAFDKSFADGGKCLVRAPHALA